MLADAIGRAALPELRAEAEATMLDTFTAYAFEAGTDADGMQVNDWIAQGETLGKVSGRSRQGDTNTRTENVGGVDRPVVEGGLHIPLDAFVSGDDLLLTRGWRLTCTAVGPQSDRALVGRTWQVVDVPIKSLATARRLDVVEV